jgi:hypothetical protein
MSEWSRPRLSRPWLVGIGICYLLVFAYAFVIAGQILFAIWIGVFCGVVYLGWRFVAAFEAIADALQRIAYQREQD